MVVPVQNSILRKLGYQLILLLRRRQVRMTVLAVLHLAVWSASLQLAHLLAFGSLSLLPRGLVDVRVLLFFLLVKGTSALMVGHFRELWYRASMEDLRALLGSTLLTTGVLFLALLVLPGPGLPPRVALLDGSLTLMGLGSLRVLLHVLREGLGRPRSARNIIVGGRSAFVELEFRRMRLRPTGDRIIGLVLEDMDTKGGLLRRVPLLNLEQAERLLMGKSATAVIVVPPVSAAFHGALGKICLGTHVPCEPVTSPHALSELVETASEEFLERPPIRIDMRAVADSIMGRRVMVTGGGGSIGSELARQLLKLMPSALILVDRSENALFHIERDLVPRCRDIPVQGLILDVCDAEAVRRSIHAYRPEMIFHAAAHKHVPLMERHPCEAFLNNVVGTRNVADAADELGVQTLVYISTDKAVEPSSIMGVTKRVGEMYIRSLARARGARFAAVRFGNVLGSSGSVVPIFIDQIKRGQPITVTHPEMSRYFMSIPEACQLVLEASVLSKGGEIFVLDMGQPVKIVDLARRLIRRAGLRPGDDVPIVFSGTRPGEKLSERLFCAQEQAQKTPVPGIWRVEPIGGPVKQQGGLDHSHARLVQALDVLAYHARAGDHAQVVRLMAELVPEYTPEDLYFRRILAGPVQEVRFSSHDTALS